MSNRSPPQPAPAGSLNREASEDLKLLIRFLSDRDNAIAGILTRRFRRNPVMDEIVRQMMVAFGEGQILKVSDYQRRLSSMASRSSVRGEIAELEDLGALILLLDETDSRTRRVTPTVGIVAFYNKAMPALRDEAAAALCRHQPIESDFVLFRETPGL